MMAGTKPPDLSNAISTLAPSQKFCRKNKKTRWACLRQRAKSV
jgi:hypothetical protein